MRINSLITLTMSLLLSLPLAAQEGSSERPWTQETEAGLVSATGNTRSQSYLIKNSSSYKFDKFLAKLNGSYLSNETSDNTTNVTTANEKWDAELKLERELSNRFSTFVAQGAESDKESGIDRRYNSDIGGKYYIARSEGYYTFAELGYRYSTEEYVAAIANESFDIVRAYIESQKSWSPTLSSKFWIEYLPKLNDSDDFNINSELSVQARLDNVFSVKTAYLVKFDNIPAAIYKTDTLFSTALIAKF